MSFEKGADRLVPMMGQLAEFGNSAGALARSARAAGRGPDAD
jgi:hypothetical protein